MPGRPRPNADADGYDAVQLAFDEVAERKLTKPELGHLRGHGVAPHRRLVEIRGRARARRRARPSPSRRSSQASRVKVSGVSIGKGFQGTIKRHRFHRGPASHGSHNIRKPGSVGASAYPSRVFKGMKMAGHMGADRVTQRGLTVVDRDPELNLLLVKGAVPGPKNGVVVIREDA